MSPVLAAMLGGSAVAAGTYSYQKLRPRRDGNGSGRVKATLAEFRGLVGDLREVAASGVTVVFFRPAAAVGKEARTAITAVYSDARDAFRELEETELKPMREALGEELRALRAVVQEDEGRMASMAREVIDLVTPGVGAGKRSIPADGPGPRRRVSMSPRAFWRSIKQAKELVFDESRSRQLEEIEGPAAGSARSQIAIAEQVVDRYLKVASISGVFAIVGTLFYPPLKLISGAMILYAAWPVFKGAWHDVFVEHRISVKILDSVSFIGLLAGGYFLICSITSTIFHASTKMMLKTEDRSRLLLANMFGQQPRTVHVLMEGEEIEVPFETLSVGDTVVVHAGQMIPIDGLVSKGTAAVDQHVLTGESQPAEKGPRDRVFAATVMLAGRIEVLVEKTGSETAAAQIRDALANTTDFRNAIQARWRGVADKTVLPTLGIAGIALAFLSPARALAVINSNYVAVMKVASPLGMLNFLQRASQAGILIKDGRALEASSKIDTVIFDKTGTLTENQPHVGEIYSFGELTDEQLLTYAAAVEANQSHPIGQAILHAATLRNLVLPPLDEARYEVGYGIEASIGGSMVRVGSARYMSMQKMDIPEDFAERRAAAQAGGASVVYIGFEDRVAGAIVLLPTLRPEAKEVVGRLQALGLTLYIISGDSASPTEALASELGITHFFAEVLPQDKSGMVEKLQNEGRQVCFVGDGINDAIALKKANVSVSLRGASSLATNTAQIILMDESLKQLAQLFEIAGEYDANLKKLMATTFIPGFLSLAGVFLLGTGNATALTLFNLSMIAGLVNAIWPALQNQEDGAAAITPMSGEKPEI